MRRAFIALLLVACSGPTLETDVALQSVALPSQQSALKVLLWGQSNAVGQGTRADASTAVPFYPRYLDEHVGTAHFYERLGPVLQDIPLNPAFAAALGGISPKRGVGTSIGSRLVGSLQQPVIATIARSGTAIAAWGVGQSARTSFDTYADELVSDLGSSGWHIVVIHGESDAQGPVTAAAYQTNLTSWVAHMRVKFPGARIYVGRVNVNCAGSDVTTVRAAQAAYVASDNNAELIDSDSYGFATPHFTDPGIDSYGDAIGLRILANTMPPIVMQMFNGWPNAADLTGGTSNPEIDPRQSGTFQADWTSRIPLRGPAMYGTGIDAQAYMDGVLLDASSHGIDALSFLTITPPEIYHATVDTDPIRENISIPYQKYFTSPNKSLAKFMLVLQATSLRYPYPGYPTAYAGIPPVPVNTTDGGAYLTAWGTWVAQQLADPQYLVMRNGRKPLGLLIASAMPAAMWTTFTNAVTAAGQSFDLVDWNNDISSATRLGATTLAAYPPNPWIVSGIGQHAYSAQAALDVSHAVLAGFRYTSFVTPQLDGRPLSHTGSDSAVIPWIDQPTQPELYAHCREMFTRERSFSGNVFLPDLAVLHGGMELAEDGQAWIPTVGESDRYALAVKWAKDPRTRPSAFSYNVHPEIVLVTKSGTWTMVRKLGPSIAHANRVMQSSTSGDSLSFTHIAVTGFALYGSTGPGFGSVQISIDGSVITTVSLAGSAADHVLLWTSSTLAEASHTLLVTLTANAATPIDAIGIACNPSSFT